ncbi:MAG: family 10 glycosylhydrolase [Ruminococcus sp.]|nr:family 10 glycosylhydrolase [Ruminococcus sp.]
MKIKINLSVLITIALLIISIIISSAANKDANHTDEAYTTYASEDEINTNEKEMRGLWVSFITLDMTDSDMSFEAFRKKFDKIVNTAVNYKLNTLIVQVRPFCDALYKSEVFPYSHILTGTQDKNPGYDPLEYMCKTAHSHGLEIHAWINPYRVATSTTPKKLSNNNPYVNNPDIGMELDSGIYLNPAKKASRKLVCDGIKEIINNYPVDGIQFDDYFYPSDIKDEDAAEYNTYKKAIGNKIPLSVEEWRMQNVNILIAEAYSIIKCINKEIDFGISPQGNIENNKDLCADIKSWSEIKGYVDYICPQMYYSTENPSLRFEDNLLQWKEFEYHSDIKVYIGLGAYKAGTDADKGTWLNSDEILANELSLLREYKYSGFMIYDYSAFESKYAKEELNNLLSVID